MAIINRISGEVNTAAIEELGLQPNVDGNLSQINSVIQPVVNINKKRYVNISKTVSGTGIIYSTPATKQDFYLTSWTMIAASVNQNSAPQNYITGYPAGAGSTAIGSCIAGSLAATTGTGQNGLAYSVPMKITRGTDIVQTVGTTFGHALINGYLVDTEN